MKNNLGEIAFMQKILSNQPIFKRFKSFNRTEMKFIVKKFSQLKVKKFFQKQKFRTTICYNIKLINIQNDFGNGQITKIY